MLLCIFNSVLFVEKDKIEENIDKSSTKNILRSTMDELLKIEPNFLDKALEVLFKCRFNNLANTEKNRREISWILAYLAIKPRLDYLFEKYFKKAEQIFNRKIASLWKSFDIGDIDFFLKERIKEEPKE